MDSFAIVHLTCRVILFIIISTVCTNFARAASNEDLIKAIEAQAFLLTFDSFQFDPIYVQKVNRATNVSHYSPYGSQNIVFSHHADDTGKDVVVLRETEDRLQVKKSKRLYIVFRKRDTVNYFVTAALIRDAHQLDISHPKFKVNGIDRLIEWETFDDHLTPARNQIILNALFCVSTFLSPCSFNTSVVSPTTPKSPHYTLKNVPVEADKVKMVTSDGSDPDDNFDLYADLFSSAPPVNSVNTQGRFFGGPFDGFGGGIIGAPIGAVGGIVGGVLGAATGIVCGVLGAVFGGCGGNIGGFGLMGPPPPIVNTGFAGYPMPSPAYGYGPGPGFPPGGVLGRKKRQAGEPSLDYSGWKTQYTTPTAGSTLKYEKEIFYGFGNCPATPVDPKELETATTNNQIIDFYLKVLRADCLSDRRAVIFHLLSDGLLIIKGKTININPASPKIAQHKLNLKDTLELASVAELRAFTQIYNEEVQTPNMVSKSPDGQKDISRSINFVTEIILRFLKESRLWVRTHMIRLTRYLIILLKSIFAKVQQDQQILQKCPDCTKDKEMNANDRLQVVGLLEFIKHGIGPVDKGEDPKKVFTIFFSKNLQALGQLVQYY